MEGWVERDCERYLCPLGGAAGFGKIWAAEMRRCVRHVTRREEVCASEDSVDPWYLTWKGRGDMRVSHPQQTTRRIGNKVKDIKSSATIRQSLFRETLPCFTSRSYRYSCVADVVCRRDNRKPSVEPRKLLSKGCDIILEPAHSRATRCIPYIIVHRTLFYTAAP